MTDDPTHAAYLDQVAALVAAEIRRVIATGDVAIGHPAAMVRVIEARLPRPAGISLGDLAGHVRAALTSLCSVRIAETETTLARLGREKAEASKTIAFVDLAEAHGFGGDTPPLVAFKALLDRGLIDDEGNILPRKATPP